MAVASSIDATAVGIVRSFDEAEDDRRIDPRFMEGVRERASRCPEPRGFRR